MLSCLAAIFGCLILCAVGFPALGCDNSAKGSRVEQARGYDPNPRLLAPRFHVACASEQKNTIHDFKFFLSPRTSAVHSTGHAHCLRCGAQGPRTHASPLIPVRPNRKGHCEEHGGEEEGNISNYIVQKRFVFLFFACRRRPDWTPTA